MESSYMQKKLIRKYPISSRMGIRHVEDLGYPSLEPYFSKKPTENLKTVLWTPRWSYDSKLGGSHFVEYKDMPFTILKNYEDLRCIFRPHPLMFGELKSKKLMTETEVEAYVSAAENCGIVYDTGTPIDAVLDEADVLIADYSSIIIMYFLTGKPIIYCKSQIEFNETFRKLSQYMYIVESEEDIYRYLDQLSRGDDCLKEECMEFISREFSKHINSSMRIADRILFDATGKDSKG
jgi:CDP-glycerol glycerophosphotransferase (TagB/SpsB family)